MKCRNFSTLLSAYVDRELSSTEMSEVREHLADCTTCQFEAERLAGLKRSLAGLKMFDPPVGMESRLRQAVFSSPRISRNTWTLVGLLAASSVAGAYFAVHLAARPPLPERPVAQQTNHDLQIAADRTYLSGSDPMSGGASVVSVSYAGGH